MQAVPFSSEHQAQVVDLIVGIQRGEFGIDIDAERQPDLATIRSFYQARGGNFWVALEQDRVVGTISLLDIGEQQGALRKMFVHPEYRGAGHGTARLLLETLLEWANERHMKEIYLGTTALFHAAHRFYEKHGFTEIPKSALPPAFPVMEVDTRFYRLRLEALESRELERDEISDVWSIDRAETIEGVYRMVEDELVLDPVRQELGGWPAGERELYDPILRDCYDRGGTFYGVFDGGRLVGAVALDGRLMGGGGDRLQLAFLHVSRAQRRSGLGRRLFEMAVAKARRLGARSLYISATPTANTVRFYLELGCRLTEEIDPELFELEPEDIHLEYEL